ncbi:MAG: PP0621 family protein [Comamonadaceae bacterium]|nr:hypothetical protein [Burkholderiales bacterium]MEB2347061.1 PP0621 family protein [Comamonadaceae bacterium]
MTKYLLIIAVIALVYAIARGQRPPPQPPGARTPRTPREPQEMVACAHCGVHLPREEALTDGAQTYCCAAHRDKGPA